MKDATHQFDGTVIKTIGDEVMATFPDRRRRDEAAATQMQARISSTPVMMRTAYQVTIRIGCHFGPVVQGTERYFRCGRTHGESHDLSGQSETDRHVRCDSRAEWVRTGAAQTRQIDIATVRGRIDEVALYRSCCGSRTRRPAWCRPLELDEQERRTAASTCFEAHVPGRECCRRSPIAEDPHQHGPRVTKTIWSSREISFRASTHVSKNAAANSC